MFRNIDGGLCGLAVVDRRRDVRCSVESVYEVTSGRGTG